MEGPRPPRETEYPQVLDFLHQELRPSSTWSLANEYPTALSLANLHNIRIIVDAQKVLSHAVLKPLMIRTPLAVLKVGAIGSVVTESNYRNQGLSRKILEDCLQEARNQDCDVAMLWTDLYEFYQKMNFELAGTEMSFVIENEFEVPAHQLRFHQGQQISPEAILRLYSQHTVTSVRTAEDIRKFLQIPQTVAYTAWDPNNQLVAYAIEGKGADLTGYIHEWGGSVPHLMALFSHIRKERKSSFTVITSEHSANLVRNLRSLPGVVANQGFLGMIKIVSMESFFQKIKRAARSLGLNDFVLEKRGDDFCFGFASDLLVISDEKDLIRLLFGPAVEIPHLKKESLIKISKFLPLPMWVWGWDSV
ncbi:MAG: GNAT family N-acetyltransferase [Pseudobdellovibrionaceae bacterium]